MLRNFLILSILVVILSCNENRKTSSPGRATDSGILQNIDPITDGRLRFDFSIADQKLHCALYNDAADTAYFLGSSCEGSVYSLLYDTSRFTILPMLLCNASYPVVLKIPPKDKVQFTATLFVKKQESKIRLGIGIYEVQKDFDLKNTTLQQIFNSGEEGKTILWAPVKKIN